jgi:cardiolipin synthase
MQDNTRNLQGICLLKLYRHMLLWLALALASGCASLPDISLLKGDANAAARPNVIGQGGLLSPERSQALLQQLQKEGKTDLLERHLAFMQAIEPVPVVAGNSARLLVDGPQTYRAMFAAIAAAQDHINLETYILEEEGAGQDLAELLLRSFSCACKRTASMFANLTR